MPALVYKQTDGSQKQLTFGAKPLIIGRLPESEIQVRDAFLSRVHAGISYINNAFVLKDLGSTNGTYRNGARVYECNLATGDRIQVGNASLIFEIDAATGDATLRPAPAGAVAPRQTISPPLPPGAPRPNEIKMTVPVQIPPPANPR
jgi:adenylate cyclase